MVYLMQKMDKQTKQFCPSLYCPYCGRKQNFKLSKQDASELLGMAKLECYKCDGVFWADPFHK